jgi:hypothetical protein
MSSARWRRPYLYLLLAFFSLLLPGSFPLSQIRAAWCMVAVFFLPGYLTLTLLAKPSRWEKDLFEKATLALAVSLALLVVPWVQVFLLRFDLRIAVATILGFDLVLLLFLLIRGRPTPLPKTNRFKAPIPPALLLYVSLVVFLVFLFGGNVFGDGYSYMTWLRNIYVGDVSPQANVHAAWESAYPSFTNIFSPLLMGYAICARMARVDPNLVWSIAPAFLTFFFLALNYSLTELLFKKRLAACIAVLITPFVVGNVPSVLGDSHGFSIFILAPLIIYVALSFILSSHQERRDRLSLVLVGLLALVLAVEHLQNLVYVLYALGAFGVFTLAVDALRRRESQTFKRCFWVVLVILLCAGPYILWTLVGVQRSEFDVAYTLERKIWQGGRFYGSSSDFLIVHPKALLSGYTTYWLGAGVLLGLLLLGRRNYRTPGGRFVCSNVLIILFLGLNPILVPFMSKLFTAQVVYRIGEMLPAVPVLSYVLYRTYLAGVAWFQAQGGRRRPDRLTQSQLLVLVAVLVVLGVTWVRHAVHMSLSAVNLKVVHVVYGPDDANPNWLDKVIRGRIAAELENPPFPILEQPTQLNRVLDGQVIRFITGNTAADSVFLADQLAEFSLPAYADQLAFVGRRGWVHGRDICLQVLSDESFLRRVTEVELLVADRLETLCTVLAPETDVAVLENLLQHHAGEIDYILITPSFRHLKGKLENVDLAALIYDEDGFAIYRLDTPRE